MIQDGVTYRIIKDHLGSPRLVVDANTGDVAQELEYDAFGMVLTDARDHDASVGRWTKAIQSGDESKPTTPGAATAHQTNVLS